MSYKHHKITGVRKVVWDQLWHVMYEIGGKENWDRVNKKEALSVIEKIEKERGNEKDDEKQLDEVKDGEWVRPKRMGYILECCDCGLRHKMDFKLIKSSNGRTIMFRAFRIDKIREC